MSSQERWSQLTAALLEMRQNVLTLEQQVKTLQDAVSDLGWRPAMPQHVEVTHVQS